MFWIDHIGDYDADDVADAAKASGAELSNLLDKIGETPEHPELDTLKQAHRICCEIESHLRKELT